MLNFGLEQKNVIIQSENQISGYNGFNVHHLALSLPLYKKMAIYAVSIAVQRCGLQSSETETDPEIINNAGDIKYQKYGNGGITKLLPVFRAFIQGSGAWCRGYIISAPLTASQTFFYNKQRFQADKYRDRLCSWRMSAKFGLQYTIRLNEETSATLGATYSLKAGLPET